MALHFIAATLLTKELVFVEEYVIPQRTWKKKGKRDYLNTKGVFTIKDEKVFVANLVALPQQTQPPVERVCWDFHKKEDFFFDVNDYLMS